MINYLPFYIFIFFLFSHAPLLGKHVKMVEDTMAIDTKDEINIFLMKNTVYPMKCLKSGIAGDVVFSLTINKAGLLDSLALVISPNESLTTNSFESLIKLAKKWRPVNNDSIEIDKKYVIVFRYRIFMDNVPPDYFDRAKKSIAKQKYEKALKLLDKAVENNIYERQFYLARSEVKKKLGDEKGVAEDLSVVKRLDNNILSIVNIIAIGKSRSVKVGNY